MPTTSAPGRTPARAGQARHHRSYRPNGCWPRCAHATSPAAPDDGSRPRNWPNWLLSIRRSREPTAELKAMVLARESRLMDLPGVGAVVAARILADVGDVARFADRNRFASWTGTAPLDASSGEQNRHRLSRAGNRRMNHMIHIAAVTQLRHHTEGREYYQRKRADGKKSKEALRCLKRRISDAIYRQLVADAQRAALTTSPEQMEAGPGGHCGASQESSAVDLPPHIDTSDQPLPGPATHDATPHHRKPEDNRQTSKPPVDNRGEPMCSGLSPRAGQATASSSGSPSTAASRASSPLAAPTSRSEPSGWCGRSVRSRWAAGVVSMVRSGSM